VRTATREGLVLELLPAARVVRAFNTVHYKTLRSEAHRSAERLGIPIASDDRAALDLVALSLATLASKP
jgi:predicted dinucleotide-binding enzyme